MLKKKLTFNESVAKGLTVIPIIELATNERNHLNVLRSKISKLSKIDSLYNNWIQSCYKPELQMYSNPLNYLEDSEGKSLFNYCVNNQSDALPYLMDKIYTLQEGTFESEFTSMIFCAISADKYKTLMDVVKNEWNNNNFTTSGAYIAPLPIANTKNYIRKILQNKDIAQVDSINQNAIILDNADYFSIYPNPIVSNSTIYFKLNGQAKVTLGIYDSMGKLI